MLCRVDLTQFIQIIPTGLFQIYRRGLDTTQLSDATTIPISALKAEVLAIVEHEVFIGTLAMDPEC